MWVADKSPRLGSYVTFTRNMRVTDKSPHLGSYVTFSRNMRVADKSPHLGLPLPNLVLVNRQKGVLINRFGKIIIQSWREEENSIWRRWYPNRRRPAPGNMPFSGHRICWKTKKKRPHPLDTHHQFSIKTLLSKGEKSGENRGERDDASYILYRVISAKMAARNRSL